MEDLNRKLDDLLLPPGVVWIGFDDNGRSIAASVECENPSGRRDCVMNGCATVQKCKTPSDGILFGKRLADFEATP